MNELPYGDMTCQDCGKAHVAEPRYCWGCLDKHRAPDPDKAVIAEMLREEHETRMMQTGGHKFRERCPVCAVLKQYGGGE